ncbi:8932_t:CDS:2 [Ambispora gerdemannii]|uniref:8932_t:CDS:1 n=1 Tax=Ambispora gerdemannii TaxID=144530 RepID=A0A9N8V7X9_9GLOM|nr:8932_t:CDS:2 [Ambispora gerdemannii]
MKVNSTVKKSVDSLNITIPFPPDVTSYNLIEKAILKLKVSGKTSRIPNAFIAYRMCFCKALQALNHPVVTQPQLSAISKEFWLKEPDYVREEYQKIALEARNFYKQLCIDQKLQAHEQKTKLKSVQESSLSIPYNSPALSSKSSNSPKIDSLSSSISTPKDGNELTINEIFDHSRILPSQVESHNTPYYVSGEGSINLTSPSFLSNPCDECMGRIEALTQRVVDLENKLTKLTRSVQSKSVEN